MATSTATQRPAPSATQRLNARRALQTYDAMQQHFYARDGTSLYRDRPGDNSYAALWPFTRALAATLDLEGIDYSLVPGFNPRTAVQDRLAGLDRYWDGRAYDSGVRPPRGPGGDKYYDDNAWVGLALCQHDRMRSVPSSRQRAEQVFAFVAAGWDTNPHHPHPGGVFWIEQGRGQGRSDHTRHTISNAPNAELGFHLHELTGSSAYDGQRGRVGARSMYAWVNAALDSSAGAGTGLYWDSIDTNGRIDKTIWSYNQGVMIGANVLQHRLTGRADGLYINRAESIARKALSHYQGSYFRQPPQFNAVLFRNLLLLHAVTGDAALKQAIAGGLSGYADEAWNTERDGNGLFPKGNPTLIKHAAMIQVFAVLAWYPGDYTRLA